ncbi:lanthionine synthetase LanC family protein [Hallella sp.]|uniref:lanthionine synthetase LanC family protein n=2 Tax=Hallella sp. TaxID=2980186 RepID=UPI003079411A
MDKNLQIANYLMLKSISIRNISLYHGKTGILLALYLFSHQEEKENIKEYAWDLLQDIHKDINETLPLGLEYGLAGIGLGMTLLKSHGIIDCDLNDLLYDIDQQIMMYDPRRFTDFSFRNGALGIKHYIEQRLVVEQELLSFDTFYLKELQQALVKNSLDQNEAKQHITLWSDLQPPEWDVSEFYDKPLGLDAGLSFYLIENLKTT